MKINFAMVFLIVLGAGLAAAHTGEEGLDHHGMMSGFYGMWGIGVFGWLFMILILVALILFIVWLIKQIQEPQRRRKK
jgi:uncharacterized membrane protein